MDVKGLLKAVGEDGFLKYVSAEKCRVDGCLSRKIKSLYSCSYTKSSFSELRVL